jgi:hypothetical protein
LPLSDIEEGGETAFSKSEWLNETAQRAAAPSECAHAKVFVKPRKGDALLFWDLKPDGQTGDKCACSYMTPTALCALARCNQLRYEATVRMIVGKHMTGQACCNRWSMHAGCPVIKGEKW